MIGLFAAGWLTGLMIVFLWPAMAFGLALATVAAILLAWRRTLQKWLGWLGVGVLGALLWGWAWVAMHAPLPQAEQGGIWQAEVLFEQPPSHDDRHWTADVRLVRLRRSDSEDWQRVDALVRLSARNAVARQWRPRAGERWEVMLRLKPIHGWVNFYGFDYERWAFSRGLQARAMVLSGAKPVRLGEARVWGLWRQWFADRVASIWRDSPYAGIYDALSYGERGRISDDQWVLFRETGTVHLLAISGLHMGLAAALGYGLFFWLWRGVRFVHRRIARPHFAVLGMFVVATAYGVLSGWAVSAQRAWLMVMVVGVLLLLRRNWHPWALLALAAVLVTLVHPPSVLSAGFWLSFVAVALIFTQVFSGAFRQWGRLRQLVWLQGVLGVGMLPMVLAWVEHHAGWDALVNLLLVPLLPLILMLLALTASLAVCCPVWASLGVELLDGLWRGLIQVMERAASFSEGLAMWLPFPVALAATVAVLMVFYRWPRWGLVPASLMVGMLFVLPFHDRPPPGKVWVSVLDVGQGQAVVVETAGHVLVYDAGPKWGVVDGGEAVLAHLRGHGWRSVDAVVLSHDDRDHAGGWPTLRQGMKVVRVYAGQPEKMAAWPCEGSWQWDGVRFELFQAPGRWRADNDRSCVLKVSVGEHGFLAAGDLSRHGEQALVRAHPGLEATLLLATHHGSGTSNSMFWLDAVRPDRVVVSAGFCNPFHQPAAVVKSRWLRLGVSVDCTGCDGALWYELDEKGVRLRAAARRVRHTIFRHECRERHE